MPSEQHTPEEQLVIEIELFIGTDEITVGRSEVMWPFRLLSMADTAISIPQILMGLGIIWRWMPEDRLSNQCFKAESHVLMHLTAVVLCLCMKYLRYNNSDIADRRYKNIVQSGITAMRLFEIDWMIRGAVWVIKNKEILETCKIGSSSIHSTIYYIILLAHIKYMLPVVHRIVLIALIWIFGAFEYGENTKQTSSGATENMLKELSTEVYSSKNVNIGAPAPCCICLSNYEEKEELCRLPCSHIFHKDCVEKWLVVNAQCPTCRVSIKDSAAVADGIQV